MEIDAPLASQTPPLRTYDVGKRMRSGVSGTGTSRQDDGPGAGAAQSAVVVMAGLRLTQPPRTAPMANRTPRLRPRGPHDAARLTRVPPAGVVTPPLVRPRLVPACPPSMLQSRHTGKSAG